jgi:Sec-independent protein secretion pathway component TatC
MDENKYQELEERIQLLEKQLAKYQGFIGGVIFLGGSVWAFIELVFPYLMKFKGGG